MSEARPLSERPAGDGPVGERSASPPGAPEEGSEPSVAAPSGVAQPVSSGAVSDWATYRRLLAYVKPYWFVFVLGVVGFQIGSAAEAYFAKMFGDLIDSWPQTAMAIPLFMLVAAFARGFGEIAGEILLSRISFAVVHELRAQLFEQLLYLPSRYFDASSQGHLVSRITYNVTQLRSTATDALQTVVQDGGKLIVYLGVMFYLSWKLTLIFVVTAPIIALIVGWASRRFRRISRRIQNSMGDVTHLASEAVSGYRVVRIFGGERYERDRFNKSSLYNQRQNLKMVATKVVSTQVIQIFVAVALSVLIAVLFRPEIGGELSTGQIVTFLGLAGLMARPLRKLTEVNARLQRGLAAAEDIFSQLDEPRESDSGTFDVDRVQGHIEFRGVSFAYASGAGPVLKDLNLTIEPGQTVALVGKSGSGKSTLASLIPRFYEPDSGEILLDGQPLGHYRLDALRRQIALVTQQVTLFNGTLADNIAYGGLADASAEEIQDAIGRAHADVFIREMPDGLSTVVGDDGVLLSGGQRQRVAIARALLKNAPVLILDEATSALDTTAERHIQAALEEVMRGRTTLVIAHRLSTIEKADVILVMEDGRIVESGRHEDLLSAGGIYAELYNAQFEEADAAHAALKPGKRSRPESRATLARSAVLPMVERNLSPLARAWYAQSGWLGLLAPLSWIYGVVARRRRLRFLTGRTNPWRATVPVIVVGNITAGGTGKTPFTIWLVRALRSLGLRPGIVSRGHGGRDNREPVLVSAASSADSVGDEAPMLAARSAVPTVVCRDRVRAVQTLLQSGDCNVVVADDGLQHYGLARDIEIALIDGHRGLGNRRLLPAGPLREPQQRLGEVDWVVSTGRPSGAAPQEWLMKIEPVRFVGLGGQSPDLSVEAFAGKFVNVNAVAGIGNPGRFLQTLKEMGLQPLLTAYPDHHRFSGSELVFDNGWPVVCTEKDATKIRALGELPDNLWYLEVQGRVTGPHGEAGVDRLAELLAAHGIRHR